MTRNIELLTQIRDVILADPTKHSQENWAVVPADAIAREDLLAADEGIGVSCATACCVAGFACLLSGDRAYVRAEDYEGWREPPWYSVEDVLAQDGVIHRISDRAQDLLGLTATEADVLFDGDYTQMETLQVLDALIARKGIDWEYDDYVRTGWVVLPD